MLTTPRSLLFPAIILSAGIALAGYFAGSSLVHSRLGYRTVTVKGLSERPVKADLGFWPIRFVATGATLEEARQRLTASEAAVQAFLGTQGFQASSWQTQSIKVEDRLAQSYSQGAPESARFILTQDLLVKSTEVDKLASAARNIGDLLKVGVVFASDGMSDGPSYQFTGINTLKTEMLTEATKRAREAAAQFAKESGARVGGIQTANQGIIEINPAVEIPNSSGERQIDKKVRVVTTITYLIKG
jgi:uncharacterized protein